MYSCDHIIYLSLAQIGKVRSQSYGTKVRGKLPYIPECDRVDAGSEYALAFKKHPFVSFTLLHYFYFITLFFIRTPLYYMQFPIHDVA